MPHMPFIVEPLGQREERGLEGGQVAYQQMLDDTNALRLAAARVDAQGRAVLLLDQDRRRWDRLLIRRGLAALAQAQALCHAAAQPLGPYALQAGIAACHARALQPAQTDGLCICEHDDALLLQQPSPVVALNRAVAIGHRPLASPTARRRRCPWCRPCLRNRRWRSITGCPACWLTCWAAWAAWAARTRWPITGVWRASLAPCGFNSSIRQFVNQSRNDHDPNPTR